jgi:hypothetical protein
MTEDLKRLLEIGPAEPKPTSLPGRRKPVCTGLCLAVPMLGILLTVIVVTGDFASPDTAIGCLVALPLGFIGGVALAVTAIVRREKWVAVAVIGIVLNLFLLLVSALLVWKSLQIKF